jgi:hypothetical protein
MDMAVSESARQMKIEGGNGANILDRSGMTPGGTSNLGDRDRVDERCQRPLLRAFADPSGKMKTANPMHLSRLVASELRIRQSIENDRGADRRSEIGEPRFNGSAIISDGLVEHQRKSITPIANPIPRELVDERIGPDGFDRISIDKNLDDKFARQVIWIDGEAKERPGVGACEGGPQCRLRDGLRFRDRPTRRAERRSRDQ